MSKKGTPMNDEQNSSAELYRNKEGGIVKLNADVVERLLSFRQLAPDALESGGILIGRFIKDSFDIIADEITGPLPGDVQTRTTFYRDAAEHQKVIYQRWEESAGTQCYLGEWHTHAESHPTPSAIDFDSWRKRLENDQMESEVSFFVIVGTESILVCEGNRLTKEIYPLERVA